MINLLEQLNKPKSLAKKAEELGTPQPTQPNLAKALGASQKSAEMAPSPQAKTATQQKQMRTAQVQAEAPREQVPEAGDFTAKAQGMIDKLAGFNQQMVQQEISEDISAGPEVGVDALTQEQALAQMQAGETPYIDESQVISDVLEGGGMVEAFSITMAEIQDPEIKAYAAELGLPETATVADLKQAVDTEIDQITSIVDNARETISDPNQPSNVRQESVNLMRDYGASHLIATDAELDDFENDIQNVGLIEVDGQTLTLEEMGDNPAIAASLHTAAEAFIDNPTATPEDTGLKDNPLLYEFVKKHSNSILSTLDQSKEALAGAKQTVADNKAMTDWSTDLSPEAKQALGLEGLNIYTTEDLTSKVPGLELFKSGNASDQETIKYLSNVSPELAAEFMKTGDTNLLSDFKARKQVHQHMSAARSVDDLTSTFGVPTERLQDILSDFAASPRSYSKSERQLFASLDKNLDGKVDDWATVQPKLQQLGLDGRLDFNISGTQTREDKYQGRLADKLGGIKTKELSLQDLNKLILDMRAEKFRPKDYQHLLDRKQELIDAMPVKKKYADTTWSGLGGEAPVEEKEPEPIYTDESVFITR